MLVQEKTEELRLAHADNQQLRDQLSMVNQLLSEIKNFFEVYNHRRMKLETLVSLFCIPFYF